MTRSSRVLLEEIMESIDLIESYVQDVSLEDLVQNVEKQDSVIRRLSIIGEAVKGIPDDLKEAHPEVPWKEIAGARDVLTHEYFRVDLDLTWEMIKDDLPDLKVKIRRILGEAP